MVWMTFFLSPYLRKHYFEVYWPLYSLIFVPRFLANLISFFHDKTNVQIKVRKIWPFWGWVIFWPTWDPRKIIRYLFFVLETSGHIILRCVFNLKSVTCFLDFWRKNLWKKCLGKLSTYRFQLYAILTLTPSPLEISGEKR